MIPHRGWSVPLRSVPGASCSEVNHTSPTHHPTFASTLTGRRYKTPPPHRKARAFLLGSIIDFPISFP
jgi:hypothetical protein